MGEFDMIEDEIRKKRQRIEECEDDYRRSYKRIENQYEEANYKFQQLRHMIEEKHQIISHSLDQLGGDTTEWRYQSNRLASNFSQQSRWRIEIDKDNSNKKNWSSNRITSVNIVS